MQPTLQNPYAIIYDQNLHFFELYLLPDQIFDSLFTGMTVSLNVSYKGVLLMVLLMMVIINTQFKTRVLKPYPTKMAKIDTLSMTKTAEKPYRLGPHIPI